MRLELRRLEAAIEATSVADPETGKITVSKEDIKKVSLKYCLDTLNDIEPMEGFEKGVLVMKDLHDLRMKCEDGEFSISKDTFQKVVQKIKKSGKHNYDFLTKSCPKYQDTMFRFCQRMIQEEIYPDYFQQTTLHMIFKGGIGKNEELASNRFIYSKSWLPRLAEGLLVEAGLKASCWPTLAGTRWAGRSTIGPRSSSSGRRASWPRTSRRALSSSQSYTIYQSSLIGRAWSTPWT